MPARAGLVMIACAAGLTAGAVVAWPEAAATPAVKPAPARPAPSKTVAKPAVKKPTPRPAKKPQHPDVFSAPADATSSPAYRYGQLAQDACEAELKQRGIGFTRDPARGVLAPVRLTGPLRGVTFRTELGDKARATSPWEIADCRLVLALDDFAALLARRDIVEVRHYSMYRPPTGRWAEGQIGTRHNGALALDAARFIAKDGTVLDVDKHFHGSIDAPTCGPKAAPNPATPEALALRALLCEAVDQRLFNVVLTPNYDAPHKNHFHLEVTAGVKWFLVH